MTARAGAGRLYLFMLAHPKRLAHEDRLRGYFDRLASNSQAAAASRQLAAFIIASLAPSGGERILDIGCGEGSLCRSIAAHVPNGSLVGIDVSGEMIRLARASSAGHDNILYAPGSIEEVPWTEDYFDHVLAIDTLLYAYSTDWALREIFRVAAWGGRIHLLLTRVEGSPVSAPWPGELGPPPEPRSANAWRELAALQGFAGIEVSEVVIEEAPRSLWLTARKPDLPPPGPLESLPPDPFRVIG